MTMDTFRIEIEDDGYQKHLSATAVYGTVFINDEEMPFCLNLPVFFDLFHRPSREDGEPLFICAGCGERGCYGADVYVAPSEGIFIKWVFTNSGEKKLVGKEFTFEIDEYVDEAWKVLKEIYLITQKDPEAVLPSGYKVRQLMENCLDMRYLDNEEPKEKSIQEMDDEERLTLIGNSIATGKTRQLENSMIEDAMYHSDLSHKHITGKHQVGNYFLGRFLSRHGERYTFKIIELEESLVAGVTIPDIWLNNRGTICKKGLLLYGHESSNPIGVVYMIHHTGGYIREIFLSRNTEWFNVEFSGSVVAGKDCEDTPYTVRPVTGEEQRARSMLNAIGAAQEQPVTFDDGCYVWRQADSYFKRLLSQKGYTLIRSEVYDDCIGYTCKRNDDIFAIYMYAFSEGDTDINGATGRELMTKPQSIGAFVLVATVRVEKMLVDGRISYRFGYHKKASASYIEFWHPTNVNGESILVLYQNESLQLTYEVFMYAFNHDHIGAFSNVFQVAPRIIKEGEPPLPDGDSAYGIMYDIHQNRGPMKWGYYSPDGVFFGRVPYVKDYGWFDCGMPDERNSFKRIEIHTLEDLQAKFIYTDEMPEPERLKNVPELMAISVLEPVLSQRFALKMEFEGGETSKYVLPVGKEGTEEKEVNYNGFRFTDEIWKSATLTYLVPKRGNAGRSEAAIVFNNGFILYGYDCYLRGRLYSEPVKCREVLYADENLKLEKIWSWNVNSMYEDEETGILKVLLRGAAFNWNGVSTYASKDGDRLTSLNFYYIDDFADKRAIVGVYDNGQAFVDEKMNFITPINCEDTKKFSDGIGRIKVDGTWYLIDTSGKRIDIERPESGESYKVIEEFSEGLCRVSTLSMGMMSLAYHSDYEDFAGKWGYIDKSGKLLVQPQYIYAKDFEGGIALVCKGEWTKDKKWDNEYNRGRYWTETELWGGIDKTGKEVIPCVFDEIKEFWDTTEVFQAHYGGWKEGHWGVIDRTGKWLVEPIFADLDYEISNGMFAFYNEGKRDDPPMGIYDLDQNKVIFEPQFKYVSFNDDGTITVEVDDETGDGTIEKIIDKDGNELLNRGYTHIYNYSGLIEVTKVVDGKNLHGLVDKDGNEIVPCKYEVSGGCWPKFYPEQRKIAFSENGKLGLCDFEDNVILPAEYDSIQGVEERFLIVGKKISSNEWIHGIMTHEGKDVLPMIYSRISVCSDRVHIIAEKNGGCEMLTVNPE